MNLISIQLILKHIKSVHHKIDPFSLKNTLPIFVHFEILITLQRLDDHFMELFFDLSKLFLKMIRHKIIKIHK